MLVDLNVRWPQKSLQDPLTSEGLDTLKATLSTLHILGYTHVAINITVNHSDKLPNTPAELNPMKLSERFAEFMKTTGMKLYSRITLIIDDPSKGQSLSRIAQHYDILAALPISERGLALATANMDIDLITFHYGQRLPTVLKHKAMGGCVKRGVKVEITYADALRDVQSRRIFVNNVRSVIRSTRSRGIVVSGGCNNALECRNLIAVMSIFRTLGLPNDKCTKAMNELASLALLNGRLRNKSYKQTIGVGDVMEGGVIQIVDRKRRRDDDDIQ